VKTKGGHCGLFNNQGNLFFLSQNLAQVNGVQSQGQTDASFSNHRGKIIKLKNEG
jgi:hypothetical protein